MTISDSTLNQSVWLTIYDLINAGSYTTSVAPTISAAWINGTHAPYPQIIINPINKDSKDYSLDNETSTKVINVSINIFVKKNKDLDILTDEVNAVLNTNIDGLSRTATSEEDGTVFPNEAKVKVKTLTYTYVRR